MEHESSSAPFSRKPLCSSPLAMSSLTCVFDGWLRGNCSRQVEACR